MYDVRGRKRGKKRVFFCLDPRQAAKKSLVFQIQTDFRLPGYHEQQDGTQRHPPLCNVTRHSETKKISTTKSISSSVLTFLFRRRRRGKKREGVTQRYSAPPPGLNGSGYSNPGTRVRYPRGKNLLETRVLAYYPGIGNSGNSGKSLLFLGRMRIMRHAIFLQKYFFACYSSVQYSMV